MRIVAYPSFEKLILPFVEFGEVASSLDCKIINLKKNMSDLEIFDTYFGGEEQAKKITFPLYPIHSVVLQQEEIDTSPLLTNGMPNIFYVLSYTDRLLVVEATMQDNYFALNGLIPNHETLWAKGSRVFGNVRLLH